MTRTEHFLPRDSLVHHLDPRVKLVTALALIVGIVLTPETAWPAYPLLWALIASMAVLARVGVFRLARLGGVALPFALAAITLVFTTPGDPVFSVLGQPVTDAGIGRFAAIMLKSWLSVQVALLLSISTPFTDLLWALGSLRVPATLVAIIGFMYRYLGTLRDEAERLVRARAARSARLRIPDDYPYSGTRLSRIVALPGETLSSRPAPGRYRMHYLTAHSGMSLRWRARVTGHMVGSLFLRSYERSERVYAAMVARGYCGQLRRLDPPPLTRRAVLIGALPILALILIETLALLWWKG